MFGKKKEKKSLNFKTKEYSMEESYESKNLVVGNLSYISSEATPYGPMVITTEQKYIFEVIKEDDIMYREIFTGFKASDKESGYFDLPYIVNIKPLTETLSEVAAVLPKYSLLLVLNEINKKPNHKTLKKTNIIKFNK